MDEWEADYQAYSKRLEDKPNDHHTLCNRSFVLLRLDRYSEALADAERCLSVDNNFAKGHLRRAQALDKLERSREALEALLHSLRLDARDKSSLKLLLKLDEGLRSGLDALHRLQRGVADRRSAVRNMMSCHADDVFAEKWSRLETESRRKLVVRMLTKGFEEIKTAFVESFRTVDYAGLQQELLAVNVVLMSDLVDQANHDEVFKDGSPRAECGMLRRIVAVAEDRENTAQLCGEGMAHLMQSYRYPPFRHHPDGDVFSNKLIQAQRSTLCLVVSHLLLGGDGLPTVSPIHPTSSSRYVPAADHFPNDESCSISDEGANEESGEDSDNYSDEIFFRDDGSPVADRDAK